MSRRRLGPSALALSLGMLGFGAPGLAQAQAQTQAQAAAQPKGPHLNQCFFSRDYEGFRPINDHAFYVRARVNEFFRIELQGACPEITYPDARLITVVRGTDEICGPLDWDLKVGQSPPSIAVPCIVKSQTRLTPAEAAAIPPKQKP